jgi:hypothetical protein
MVPSFGKKSQAISKAATANATSPLSVTPLCAAAVFRKHRIGRHAAVEITRGRADFVAYSEALNYDTAHGLQGFNLQREAESAEVNPISRAAAKNLT